jgi:putative FmdB family regulatory protein
MPTYDYSCSSCEHIFEARHGFNEDAPPCPECGKNKLEQIINDAPLVFIKGEPSTIGQLADRNTKKMGRYELENKRREDNMDKHKKHKEVREKRHRLNKMTAKQKTKWIREGD